MFLSFLEAPAIGGVSASFFLISESLSPCSAILSNSRVIVSRRLIFALSMASNFDSTESTFETMLPILCSIRSTRRAKLKIRKDLIKY